MDKITNDLYHVGDSGCSVFLVDTGEEGGLVLIDAGMNIGIIEDIEDDGFNIKDIKHCFLTHCHIDHIAACNTLLKLVPNIKFYAHELDADPIENKGHGDKTAATWYGTRYEPVKLFKRLNQDEEKFQIGKYMFNCIHTPGHTPGSISIYVKMGKKGVLFGQDVHGPFMKAFGSNINDYQNSMQKLLDLNADILCEGHFGIFQPAEKVKRYIEGYMKSNR